MPKLIICARYYYFLSSATSVFELHTINDNWPNIKMNDGFQIEIIVALRQNIRTCVNPKLFELPTRQNNHCAN
ncbi:phage repressor [Legionella waltersii]|uniref:Phage repressor n=1 Tax=Legionella waltersii TaxID=66969 RepID=A0A0W1APD2_9GAMM|nr:phage repressor [Legionella waltersii]SNU96689.1 phage repressor [Legionella waltersii]